MDRLNVQHRELHEGRWAELPFSKQMANIGSEVSRCVKWKRKGNAARAEKAFFRALELMDLTIEETLKDMRKKQRSDNPENSFSGRLKELCRAREELCDYYTESDFYVNDPEKMICYYDQFALIG